MEKSTNLVTCRQPLKLFLATTTKRLLPSISLTFWPLWGYGKMGWLWKPFVDITNALTLMFQPEAQGSTWPRRPPLLWTCWESKQCDNRISTRASSLRLDQHLKITTHTTKPMRKWKKPLKKNSQPLLLTSGKKVLSLNEVTSCCQKSSIDYLVPPQKSVQQETILLKLKNQTLNYEEKCAVA